jgi:endogenous inhibitor of DNA gyrase (YacG/DUF329 family)
MTPKQPFFIIGGGIFLPPKVQADSAQPCPTCGLPAVHVQPRAIKPAYAFRCEGYHEWAVIEGEVVTRNWESFE